MIEATCVPALNYSPLFLPFFLPRPADPHLPAAPGLPVGTLALQAADRVRPGRQAAGGAVVGLHNVCTKAKGQETINANVGRESPSLKWRLDIRTLVVL